MMTFLKRAGVLLAQVIGAISGASPIIEKLLAQYASNYVTPITNILDRLGAIFQKALEVEITFAAVYPNAKTGPQKLQGLTALIAPIISEVELIKGKKIANATLYNQGLTKIAEGSADILNAIEGGS